MSKTLFRCSAALATALLLAVGGCGTPDNTVLTPTEMTPEQEAEMEQMGQDLENQSKDRKL